MKVHGNDISDPTAIANELNPYFCATAERIQNEDPSLKDKENTPSFEAFIKEIPEPAKNFQFKPILPNELMRAIQKQKNSRSGNIPTGFLKDAASCVSDSLPVVFSK